MLVEYNNFMETANKNTINTIKRLYQSHRIVDRLEYMDPSSRTFLEFAAKSLSFALDICGESTLKKIDFKVKESQTAYCSGDSFGLEIVLPLFYFDEQALRILTNKEIAPAIASIALVNGSTIHESLHITHTGNLNILNVFAKMFGTVRFQRKYAKVFETLYALESCLGKSNLYGVFNIIEDIYIEGLANEYHKKLLNAKNNIFFSQKDFDSASVNVFAGEEPPQDLLIFMKRIEFFANDIFDKLLGRDLVQQVRELRTKEHSRLTERAELAVDICMHFNNAELFKDEYDKTKDVGASPFGEDGEDTDMVMKRLMKGLSKEDIERLGKLLKPSKKTKRGGKPDKSSLELTKELAEDILSEELTKLSKREKNEFTKNTVNLPEQVDFYSNKILHRYGTSGRTLERSNGWGFIKELKVLRSTKTTAGEPRDKGSRIANHRLYRIATDNKIFASKTPDRKRDVELIVLVDLSGSTDMRGLYERELCAAREIHNAAIQSRMRIATVCHSSFDSSYAYWTVVGTKGMAAKNIQATDDRWNHTLNLSRSENYDGYVIDSVAKTLFTKRSSTKVLIVLSDGEPHGPGYTGGGAEDHTILQINNLRKSGHIVFCISLLGGVVSSNNRIYGKKWNIDASKGSIVQQFRKLVKVIAKGEI